MGFGVDDFKIGDRVIFRQWDDMAAEFGTDSGRDIKCRKGFTHSMRPLCGTTATITELNSSGTVKLCDFDYDGMVSWWYSVDMIAPVALPDFNECEFGRMLVGDC